MKRLTLWSAFFFCLICWQLSAQAIEQIDLRIGKWSTEQLAAEGFELDIITIVLLGGVSIFGGKGTMVGVGLSLLLVLNLRNGMSLSNVNGNTQTSIVGLLLILSVLIPNMAQSLQVWWSRRSLGDNENVKLRKEP